MEPIEVTASDNLEELSNENTRLKQLVNILIEFKEFCELIADNLHLSSDLKNTYLDIIDKYEHFIGNNVECRPKTEVVDPTFIVADVQALNANDRQEVNRVESTAISSMHNEDEESEESIRSVATTSSVESYESVSGRETQHPRKSSNILDSVGRDIDSDCESVVEVIDDVIEIDQIDEVDQESEDESDQWSDDSDRSDDKRFKCDREGCDYRCKTPRDLNRHKIRHSSGKPFHCIIDGCDNRFKRNDSFSRHFQIFHPKEYKEFRTNQLCPNCNQYIKWISSLLEHKCTEKLQSNNDSSKSSNDSPNSANRSSKMSYKKKRYNVKEDGIDGSVRGEPSQSRSSDVCSTSSSTSILKKRKPNPFLAFVKQMRPVVLSEMRKELAKQGVSLRRGQVNAELGKQWQRLSDEHKNIFLDMCKE